MKKRIARLFGRRKAKSEGDFAQVKSVILKPIGDAIGDGVMHLFHLTQLKRAYPEVKTAVLVTERNRFLFEQASCVDILLEDKFSTYLSQRGKWEVYLDFQPNFTTRDIIVDFILNPQIVINFGKEDKGYYHLSSVKNYDYHTACSQQQHLADYLNYSVLSPYLTPQAGGYSLKSNEQCKNKMSSLWEQHKTRILLNPQGSLREIPPAELSALLAGIDPHYLSSIDFILTNTKGSEKYLAQLNLPFKIKLSPTMSTMDYCALIDSSDLVIAVDGGGVHLACAFEKPLLSFYANHTQNLRRWYPKVQIGVAALMVVAKNPTSDNNDTKDFPLDEAVSWLNRQIADRLNKTNPL